jgi:hypothetical protein
MASIGMSGYGMNGIGMNSLDGSMGMMGGIGIGVANGGLSLGWFLSSPVLDPGPSRSFNVDSLSPQVL